MTNEQIVEAIRALHNVDESANEVLKALSNVLDIQAQAINHLMDENERLKERVDFLYREWQECGAAQWSR